MISTLTAGETLSLRDAGCKLARELSLIDIKLLLSTTKTQIYRREIPVTDIDLLSWLHIQNNAVKIFWEDRTNDFMIAGIGAAHLLCAKQTQKPKEIIENIEKYLSSDFPNLRYLGGFCFNPKTRGQNEWKSFGRSRFVLPLIEIQKTKNATLLACNILLNNDFANNVSQLTDLLKNLKEPQGPLETDLEAPLNRRNFPDEKTWKSSAAKIINAIDQNRLEKVVLTRSVRLNFKNPVNPFVLMSRLRQTASNCFCFIFQFQDGESFLGTSPERLYRRDKNQIATEALAGTRPRNEKLSNDLLSSEKDRKEQDFVSRMIHDNLKMLCLDYVSDQNPSLLNWSAGHHLITRFKGQLKHRIGDQQLIEKLSPTPAVAGTPTDLALAAIRKNEPFDRGWYCGPVGYIGLNTSEFAVAIRCGLLHNKSVYLYAGAGIIKESLPASEWDETQNKLTAFLNSFYENAK